MSDRRDFPLAEHETVSALSIVTRVVGQMIAVLGAMVLVVVTQACGTDTRPDGDAGDNFADDPEIVSVDLQPVDESGEVLTDVATETLDETVSILRRRLDAIGMGGVTVSREGNTIVLQGLPVATAQPDVIDLVVDTARLSFRPVLGVLPPEPTEGQPGTRLTLREDILVDQEVTLADSEGLVYELGPTFTSGGKILGGEAVEDATAALNGQGEWVVNPVFKDGADGIGLFNAAAGSCFRGEPICPAQQGGRGQLAIVLDGEVITAPSINEATFARDQIQISGSFEERSAEAVAAALRYGELPVRLEQR
jgi:preprotein translocase subunit SecD